MIKKIVFFCFLLTGGLLVKGQVVRIIDKESGHAIELVTVSSDKPRASAVSNTRGQVNISAFKGAELIEIRVVGYTPLILGYSDILKMDNEVALEQTTVNLDEVVISASQWNQKSSEIPNKVITIQPKTVALINPQTAADLLGVSGRVYIQKSQQGGGSPMIRGFATNRLLYTIDGVRMNTAIFRGGNIQNVISLDPFAIEHTEVLFGAGSVIYGSDAIGGVMSFQTLRPQLSLKDKLLVSGKAVARYSSANNENTGHFNINVGGKRLAGITSISYSKYGDLKMGSEGPDEYLRPFYVERKDGLDAVVTNMDKEIQTPSGYEQFNLMQRLRLSPGKNWDIDYGFHYSETSNYSRYDRHIRNKNGIPRYGEWYYGPQKWMMNNLSLTNKKKSWVYDQIALRLASQKFEESRISRDFNEHLREHRVEQVAANSVNLNLIKSLGSHRLYYGAEAVQNNVRSKGVDENILNQTTESGPARYPNALWQSFALYLSGQFNLGNITTIHTGARLNNYILECEFDTTFYPFSFTSADINNNALTGSFGLVVKPDNTFVFSTNFSTAFRSPNVDDIGKVFDSEPGAVTIPNPDLEAEIAYNFDLGFTKVFADKIKMDLTAYYTLLENALVRRDYTMNGHDSIFYHGEMSRVQAIQNAAEARIYGFQGGVEIKLPAGFSFSSDVNYQRGEEELDDGSVSPSRHAAPFFGVSRIDFKKGKLKMQLYTLYNDEKSHDEMPEEEKNKTYMYATDSRGYAYAPAWYTVNIKAMYQLTQSFSLTMGVENITDQRYRPYSSGIVAPGRNFVVSARAGF